MRKIKNKKLYIEKRDDFFKKIKIKIKIKKILQFRMNGGTRQVLRLASLVSVAPGEAVNTPRVMHDVHLWYVFPFALE